MAILVRSTRVLFEKPLSVGAEVVFFRHHAHAQGVIYSDQLLLGFSHEVSLVRETVGTNTSW